MRKLRRLNRAMLRDYYLGVVLGHLSPSHLVLLRLRQNLGYRSHHQCHHFMSQRLQGRNVRFKVMTTPLVPGVHPHLKRQRYPAKGWSSYQPYMGRRLCILLFLIATVHSGNKLDFG